MKRTGSGKLKNILLYGVVLVVMAAVIYCKRDYYMDELLSFSLSNNETGWMRVVDGTVYNPEQLYQGELMPQEGHRFDYAMVWENQTTDVHPPLYYALLHTVCSIMPSKLSKWLPASINFLFALLTLYVVRRLFCLFAKQDQEQGTYCRLTYVATLLFGILPGTLNNVSFFRMYVMAMFMVAVIAYLCVDLIHRVYMGQEIGVKTWGCLIIIAVLSALTHYYIVMYLVFAVGTLVLLLLLRRRWKDAVLAVVSSGVAAIAAIAIFPTMLEHIFSGYRGEQSADNLSNMTIARYGSQAYQLFQGISNELFGGILVLLLVVVLAAGIVWIARRGKAQIDAGNTEPVQNRMHIVMLVELLLPVVCYYLLLSAIAVQVTTRYVFPVYAVLYVGIVIVLYEMLPLTWSHRGWIMVALLVFMTVGSYCKADWRYLYRTDHLREQLETHADVSAVVVYDSQWKCVELYRQLSNVSQVCFITDQEYDMLTENGIADSEELVVFATSEEYVDGLQDYLNRDDAVLIGEHSDFKVFSLGE